MRAASVGINLPHKNSPYRLLVNRFSRARRPPLASSTDVVEIMRLRGDGGGGVSADGLVLPKSGAAIVLCEKRRAVCLEVSRRSSNPHFPAACPDQSEDALKNTVALSLRAMEDRTRSDGTCEICLRLEDVPLVHG